MFIPKLNKKQQEELFITRDDAFSNYLKDRDILPISINTNRDSKDFWQECVFVKNENFIKHYEDFYDGKEVILDGQR